MNMTNLFNVDAVPIHIRCKFHFKSKFVFPFPFKIRAMNHRME